MTLGIYLGLPYLPGTAPWTFGDPHVSEGRQLVH